MSYKNGAEVLPARLLKEIQKYIDGGLVYIPKVSKKVGWGYISGARNSLDDRNKKISQLYYDGISVDDLAKMFYLSEETIKKIIYSNKSLNLK